MNVRNTISTTSRIPCSGKEMPPRDDGCDVTVVIPMRNEEANVAAVCTELQEVMDNEPLRYEVIIVNDGSNDGTTRELQRASKNDARFRIVEFTRCFGQSACACRGFPLGKRENSRADGWGPAK